MWNKQLMRFLKNNRDVSCFLKGVIVFLIKIGVILKVSSNLVCYCMIALMVTSCASTAEFTEVDRSLITGDPCAAPCWYGLEIGVSTKEEVYSTLAGLPFINQNSIREVGVGSLAGDKEISFGCVHFKGEQCGGAIIGAGKLGMLWLAPGYELTFSDVVMKYGEPDYVSHSRGSGEQVICNISLYWPATKMIVSANTKDICPTLSEIKKGVQISPNLLVDDVTFGLYEKKWKTVHQGGIYEEWQGFAVP